MAADFRSRVEAAVRRVGRGEVASYGDVAADAGFPGAARGVGAVLRASEDLPWWRGTYADGRLAPGKEAEQGRRLRAEGVEVTAGRVAIPRDGAPMSGAGGGGTVGGARARGGRPQPPGGTPEA